MLIHGVVRGPDGSPLAGARYWADEISVDGRMVESAGGLSTLADGKWGISGVPGRYEARAEKAGYTQMSIPSIVGPLGGTFAQDIVLLPNDSTLTGSLVDTLTGNGVHSVDVTVLVASPFDGARAATILSTFTDGDGAFQLGVHSGTYQLFIHERGSAYSRRDLVYGGYTFAPGAHTTVWQLPSLDVQGACTTATCAVAVSGQGFAAGPPIDLKLSDTEGKLQVPLSAVAAAPDGSFSSHQTFTQRGSGYLPVVARQSTGAYDVTLWTGVSFYALQNMDAPNDQATAPTSIPVDNSVPTAPPAGVDTSANDSGL